jgi:formylglycine-generating enzyme
MGLVGLVVLHGSKCQECGKSRVRGLGANLGRIQTHKYAMMASLKEIVAVRVGLLAGLFYLSLLCNTAQARPKPADVGAAEIPALEATLVAAGWTMTPERSASYNVGDIYSRASNTPVAFKAKCFDAEPRENAYTSLEVVQAMKAGARVPLGIARFKAEGMEYKQLKFAEPYMTELADMDLVLKEQCQKFLASRSDLEDLFVIKAVLSAEVKEQLCRSIDGAAGALGIGASASAQQECVQASEGHVAVAYKTQEAASLVSMAAAPVATPTTQAAPVPMAAAAPSQATANVDFGGGGGGLGVAERLRQQRCDESAKVKGEKVRAARLATAEQGAQSKARTAWSGQSAELEMCASLKRAERGGCIEAVNAWLGVARAMVVSIPAGVEPIKTECGTREPVYEAVERTVVASDVKVVEMLLTRLQLLGPGDLESMATAPIGVGGAVSGSTNSIGMEFISVSPGSFQMGCTGKQTNCEGDEKPSHTITLTQGFQIQATEVTQEQYRAVTGEDPSQFSACRPDCPVENVSWYDAIGFANDLSRKEGMTPAYFGSGTTTRWDKSANGYRLPTEAEWEYAARAGQETVYSGSDDPSAVAWTVTNSGHRTHKVKTTRPNEWGLYDMSGNVLEWCWDLYASGYYRSSPDTNPVGPTRTANNRVLRSSSWSSEPNHARVANRVNASPTRSTGSIGFRLVRPVP